MVCYVFTHIETYMINPYIRAPRSEDVDFIYEHLREADREEIKAIGFDSLPALRLGYKFSTHMYTGVEPDGTPCFLMGAVVLPDNPIGNIWLLGTDAIERHSRTFLRNSKPVLEEVFNDTGALALSNSVHAKNLVHIRWLQWLGFTFIQKVYLPPHGEEFIEFVKLRG